jgi:hypothetical protein
MRMRLTASCVLPAALFAGLLAGCGGGGRVSSDGPPAGQGRATIMVHWPLRSVSVSASRLIPATANSIRVSFLSGSTEVKNTLLVRPSTGNGDLPTSTTVVDLPQGGLSVVAQAFPSSDGTGTPQAGGNTTAQIVAGKSTRVSLTLGTTITRVAILPDTVQLTGNPVTINATAFDAQGNVVLTNSWTWENSQPNVLRLVPAGVNATITALSAGSSVVTLTETESAKSIAKQFNVTVIGQ